MPRSIRIAIPDAYYHVGARGNDKQAIFDDELRVLFLRLVAGVVRTHGWTVYAYALMTNHYHLVVQIADGGLSDGMFRLNNGFARASNARFGRINHALGQRFWSRHIESNAHLATVVPYVLWNPARRGVGVHPADNRWTSFRGSVGLDHPPPCLGVRPLLELYGPDPTAAVDALKRHVSESHGRCQAP